MKDYDTPYTNQDQAPVEWTTVTIDHDTHEKTGHSIYAPKGLNDIQWPMFDWLWVMTEEGDVHLSRDQGKTWQKQNWLGRSWLWLVMFYYRLRVRVKYGFRKPMKYISYRLKEWD